MEKLSERFNVLQDQLMNIYEAAEHTLEAQIAHWTLLRREAVLLYVARQKGITRLGYQPVPPLAVSEGKAKEAIGIMLQLQSLQKSEYATEPWTLVDTSAETYRNAPEQHFKKGPVPVEVIYDKEPENANVYTMWKFVYYMDPEDVWHKTTSGVNHNGIYYLHGDFKHYYVLFADGARTYSKTGYWEVKVNKETVFAPVTSSTPPGSPGQTDTNTTTKAPATSSDSTTRSSDKQSQQAATKRKGFGRRPSSRTRRQETQQRRSRSRYRSQSHSRSHSQSDTRAIGPTSLSRSSRSPSVSKTRSRRSESRSRSRSTSSRRAGRGSPTDTTTRRRRSRSKSSSTSTSSSQRSQRGGRDRGERGGERGSRSCRGCGRGTGKRRGRSSSTSPPSKRSRPKSSRLRGVSPDEVGRSLQSVSSKHRGRLGRLLEEALDPPVILCKGGANTLKCFRNRARGKYMGLFRAISTTWSWVAGDSTERLGRPRMLISFSSDGQRKHFDETVKYPKGVETSYGNLDSL